METITLTMKENKRLKVIQEVMERKKTVVLASSDLGVSERQIYRLLSKVRAKCALGVIHGNRGKVPPNVLSKKERAEVLRLRKEEYKGFNDRHFTEKVVEQHGIQIGRESVRTLLRGAGIEAIRKIRRPRHRSRREPQERWGEMLQADSSDHDWLEGRGPRLDLIHFVDDATGEEWADFFPEETTEGYLSVFKEIALGQGLPRSLYVDKHSVFRVNRDQTQEEQLWGRRPLTTFGRAMEELGVRIIYADSAQAKGRVERRGGVHQDRLVSELRKANAKTREEARRVLRRYLKGYNVRFKRKAKSSESAFIRIPYGLDLDQILCWKEERTVANDNNISFQGQSCQIPSSPLRSTWAKCRVAVHVCLDGSLRVFYKNDRIAYFKNNKNKKIDWDKLPIDPKITKTIMTQKSTVTFSLGH